MSARVLPIGSFIILGKPLNIPGLAASNKWTANGQGVLRERCVQYIVRDASSYWLYMPSGAHKGWYELPAVTVQYCKSEPSHEVTEAVEFERQLREDEAKLKAKEAGVQSAHAIAATEGGLPRSRAAMLDAANELLLGIPYLDEQGNPTGERGPPLITKDEYLAMLATSATTGADTKPQKSDKPTAA